MKITLSLTNVNVFDVITSQFKRLSLIQLPESWGMLQIQDRSPQSRPVALECVCDWLREATGLDCGDRSWICNAPLTYDIEYITRFHMLRSFQVVNSCSRVHDR